MICLVAEMARHKVADPHGNTLRWLVRCKLAFMGDERRTMSIYFTEQECSGWTLGDKVQVQFTRVPNGEAGEVR